MLSPPPGGGGCTDVVALTKEGTPAHDTKVGRCQSCREGHCGLCSSPICTCPDRRKHRSRPGYAAPDARRSSTAPANGRPPAPPRSLTRAPKPDGPAVVTFELVEADPPVRPPKPRRLTNAERARPLLEQITAENKRTWHRIAIHPSAHGAGALVAALRKAYGEFEFKAVSLAEAGQSAVYVRWTGTARVLA